MEAKVGTLYGLGVGPGDPELLTVKAFRLMQSAPVIAYPNKGKGLKSYALEIVELYVDSSRKTMLGLVFPMTKDEAALQKSWRETVDSLWTHLADGKDVVFVTEGDPMLYSTFIHMSRLMSSLYPEVPIISVPGVSSVNAAANGLGVPLADGDETMAIVPAGANREGMRAALMNHDAVVFLKVAKVLDEMISLLEETNLVDKATVCSKVTAGDERIWHDVRRLKGASLPYLTLMVVRK